MTPGSEAKHSSQITSSSCGGSALPGVSSDPLACSGGSDAASVGRGGAWQLRTSLAILSSVLQAFFLLPVPKSAAWNESAFRLSLAWAQALAAQPAAELLWLGASTSGLNYMESRHPQAFIPALLTHAFVVVGSL